MASVTFITACATTHVGTTSCRRAQARRVMRAAWDAVRAHGVSLRRALVQAWAVEKTERRSEAAAPSAAPARRHIYPDPSFCCWSRQRHRLTLASRSPHPDAALIALGAELVRAWDFEVATIANAQRVYSGRAERLIEAAETRTASIVRRIEHTVAHTLDGLTVKALAISWCHGGEALEHDSFGDQATTNMRLAVSITNDLLAIGGRAQ